MFSLCEAVDGLNDVGRGRREGTPIGPLRGIAGRRTEKIGIPLGCQLKDSLHAMPAGLGFGHVRVLLPPSIAEFLGGLDPHLGQVIVAQSLRGC